MKRIQFNLDKEAKVGDRKILFADSGGVLVVGHVPGDRAGAERAHLAGPTGIGIEVIKVKNGSPHFCQEWDVPDEVVLKKGHPSFTPPPPPPPDPGAYQELYGRIEYALREGAEDDHGPLTPSFFPTKAWDEGMNKKTDGGIEITTRYSRDPSRSNNGGEYYFYTRFRPLPDGRIVHETRSSYEDDEWESRGVFGVVADLPAIARLAVARINAGNKPGPTNSKKLRRQIEDALRKTASDGDLVAIAGLLSVRAE